MIKIANKLSSWFNKERIKNIKIDFQLNNLVVAKENNKIIGFLCYSSYCGKMLIMLIGVKKEFQRKGTG